MTEYVSYIIGHIREGMSGDPQKDMIWLHECSEKYKNDEDAREILGEIAAMMYGLLPQEDKNALNERFEEMQKDTRVKYESVKAMVKAGDLLAARDLMDTVLQSAEGAYEESEQAVYLSFNHISEYYIYRYYFQPEKEIRGTDIPYNEYYRTQGVILTCMGAYEEAKKALNTALSWNPVDLDTLLAMGEVYKHTEELEEFLEIARKFYPYACTRATMARYYRNLAYYYLRKYQPELAGALLMYSNIYFHTDHAVEEIRYIESALEKALPSYELKELQSMLAKEHIPLGPAPDTIGIVFRVGQLMMETGRDREAIDCFSIVYDIAQDPEAAELLEKLKKSHA